MIPWNPIGYTADAYAKVPLHVGFCSEFIGTAILLLMIFALLENRNTLKPALGVFPYAPGFVIFALVGLTAPPSMMSLNGARDLSPRILAYMPSWGRMAFPGPRGAFWITSIVPIFGAVFAGSVYDKVALELFTSLSHAEAEVKAKVKAEESRESA